jgi:hypothetical protein
LDGPIAIEDSRAGGRPNRGTRPRHRCFTESSLDTGQWRTCRKTCRSLLS